MYETFTEFTLAYVTKRWVLLLGTIVWVIHGIISFLIILFNGGCINCQNIDKEHMCSQCGNLFLSVAWIATEAFTFLAGFFFIGFTIVPVLFQLCRVAIKSRPVLPSAIVSKSRDESDDLNPFLSEVGDDL